MGADGIATTRNVRRLGNNSPERILSRGATSAEGFFIESSLETSSLKPIACIPRHHIINQMSWALTLLPRHVAVHIPSVGRQSEASTVNLPQITVSSSRDWLQWFSNPEISRVIKPMSWFGEETMRCFRFVANGRTRMKQSKSVETPRWTLTAKILSEDLDRQRGKWWRGSLGVQTFLKVRMRVERDRNEVTKRLSWLTSQVLHPVRCNRLSDLAPVGNLDSNGWLLSNSRS